MKVLKEIGEWFLSTAIICSFIGGLAFFSLIAIATVNGKAEFKLTKNQ